MYNHNCHIHKKYFYKNYGYTMLILKASHIVYLCIKFDIKYFLIIC